MTSTRSDIEFPCYRLPFVLRPLRPCEIATRYGDDYMRAWADTAGPFRETRRAVLATTDPGPFVDWLAELFWTSYWNMWPVECGSVALSGVTHVGFSAGCEPLLHLITCVLATGPRRTPPESGEMVAEAAAGQRHVFTTTGLLLSREQEYQIYYERHAFAHHLYNRGEAMATTRLRAARDRAVRRRALALTKEGHRNGPE